MGYLVLVRHGESTWNAKGVWTGWQDPPLSDKGFEEAKKAGKLIAGIKFDVVYVSNLLRSVQTYEEIGKITGTFIAPITAPELKERNYGDYTGRNKWEIEKELGKETFQKLRRDFNFPVPNGETLKDVFERVIPYYEKEILPKLKEGKNVLISAHGNSLRALTKYLDNISDEEISKLEITTGQVIVYLIDNEGKVKEKQIREA